MLELKNIHKEYYDRKEKRNFTVLEDCSLQLAPGEILGLMGGSGSGKSTLARIILRLIEADSGSIILDGQEVTKLKGKDLLNFRKKVQFISQRPESFFDPVFTLGKSLKEVLEIHGLPFEEAKLEAIMELVKLKKGLLDRYPHQVSGGEIQRISLARALLLEPEYLLLDEPTSMLDISVQAQVLQLLKEIHQERKIAYLLISHDKALVEWFCDRRLRLTGGQLEKF